MERETVSSQIDLAEVAWPFCLLQLKNALLGLKPGDLLETRVSDSMIFTTIQRILLHSQDRVIKAEGSGPFYQLTILKG